MRLPLKNKQYATLFSVYVLTLEAELAEEDNFSQNSAAFSKAPLQTSCELLATSLLEWAKSAGVLHRATTCHHQHHLPAKGQSEDNLDVSSV